MKLPNSYGTVYKLSGKRRKPWIARKMIGKEPIPETRRMRTLYYTIGYYEKKADALTALAQYNLEPYDPAKRAKTVSEVYYAWSAEYFPTIKSPGVYRAAWKVLEPIGNRQIVELGLDDWQFIIDTSDKNTPTLTNVKLLLSLMYEYAVIHEIAPAAKHDLVQYIRIPKKNPNAITRKVFTREEIRALWSRDDMTSRIALILIFTGLRVGELLELKDEDVDFDIQKISVTHAKTASGIREVPIADKILPLMRKYMSEPRPYYKKVHPMIKAIGHTPHDTRHTFATLATEAGIDQRLIDAILGHSPGSNMALKVYTHFSLEAKLEAVNNLLEIC